MSRGLLSGGKPLNRSQLTILAVAILLFSITFHYIYASNIINIDTTNAIGEIHTVEKYIYTSIYVSFRQKEKSQEIPARLGTRKVSSRRRSIENEHRAYPRTVRLH